MDNITLSDVMIPLVIPKKKEKDPKADVLEKTPNTKTRNHPGTNKTIKKQIPANQRVNTVDVSGIIASACQA